MLICSMTGRPLLDPSEGIYDDGEWISWEWINGQLYKQDLEKAYPAVDPELSSMFEQLVELAAGYQVKTGRYLQIWGELGELYAEVKHGIKLHKPNTPGSDGRLGNDFIEVKTISPEKGADVVQVKSAGNFNKLLVVKISEDFQFESRIVDRKRMKEIQGKFLVDWASMPSQGDTSESGV